MSKYKTIQDAWNAKIHEVFETRSDLNNEEKAELLNKEFGANFGESAYRKRAKLFGFGLKAGIFLSESGKSMEIITKRELRIEIERKKLEIKRYEMNNLLKENSAKELINKILENKLKGLKPQVFSEMQKKSEEEFSIFFAGDEQHRGYEKELVQLRNMFKQIKKHNEKKHIVICLMGDMVEGMHRASTLLSIKKNTTGQVIDYMSVLIEGIIGLYKLGHTIDVKMVTSNHTNLRPQGKNEFPDNDMAYIIGWTMGKLTESLEGVSIEVKDILTFDMGGKSFVLLHGHQGFAKNKKSLEIATLKMFGKLPDFIVMGHYHQYKITKEGKFTLIVTPAMKISTEHYERQAGYIHEPAILKVTFFKGSQDFNSRIIHFGTKMKIQGR